MLRHQVGQLDQWAAGFITGFMAAIAIVGGVIGVLLWALFRAG